MPWKKDENGSIVIDTESGNPVWSSIDGKESPYDPEAKRKQITELTEKSRKRGEELESARASLSHFEGIEDIPTFIETAKKNAETVTSLKDKDRETEEAISRRIQDAVKNAIGPRDATIAKIKADFEKTNALFHQSLIGNAFLNSPYVTKECKSTALVRQLFSNNFRVTEDGGLVGLNPSTGDAISDEDGKDADFDGAIARMISESPFKDDVLKPAPGGAGTSVSSGRPSPDKDKMSSVERIALGLQSKGMA